MKKIGNVKTTKICAFCINWYNPCNTNLNPINTIAGFWEYEYDAKYKCLVRNANMPAWSYCPKFKPKF